MPVSDKGARSRERILEAAQQLLYEKGFAASSLGDVAAEAGVLKGNLSYYFKSKEALLEGVVEQRLQSLEQTLEQYTQGLSDPQQQLERFIAMIEDSAPTLARFGCPMGSLAGEICKGDETYQPLASRLLGSCADWLQRRFEHFMPVADATLAAEQLLVQAQGTAVLAQAFQDPDLVKRQCAQMRRWLASTLASWVGAPNPLY